MLRTVDRDLWVAESRFRVFGVPLQSRMTVVRLKDGTLWLHSPVAPTAELVSAVERLGPVCDLVAPNCFHHLWVEAWRNEFAGAHLHVARELTRKRRSLSADGVLEPTPVRWEEDFRMLPLDGVPRLGEVIFLHRPTRTLILTDLVANVGARDPWGLRLWTTMNGIYGRLGSTRFVRLMVRRREAARETLRHVLTWDFDRVIMAHGAIIERGGKMALEGALRWLLCGA